MVKNTWWSSKDLVNWHSWQAFPIMDWCGTECGFFGGDDEHEAILTKDEKYIIVINRYCDKNRRRGNDRIHIIDTHIIDDELAGNNITKSNILLPEGEHGMVRKLMITYNNDILSDCLLIGYMRFDDMFIPNDVIRLVKYYCDRNQWLHVLYFNVKADVRNKHFIVPLSLVLAPLS